MKRGIMTGGNALGLLPAHAVAQELRDGELAQVKISPSLRGLVMRAVLSPGSTSPIVDDLLRNLRGSPPRSGGE